MPLVGPVVLGLARSTSGSGRSRSRLAGSGRGPGGRPTGSSPTRPATGGSALAILVAIVAVVVVAVSGVLPGDDSGPGEPRMTAEPGPRTDPRSRPVRYPDAASRRSTAIVVAVAAGERVGVAGRTGAGKSTLALAAAGFIPRVVRAKLDGPGHGRRRWTLDAADGGALLGRVGIVFATPANQLSASKLTVREELAFGLENLGVPRAEMDARIDATWTRLGIAHLAEREPFALSGGEQQRVAIASIVAMGTSVLVLDEPTAQLDPAGTAASPTLLAELARDGAGDPVRRARSDGPRTAGPLPGARGRTGRRR